jgi:hypothetical protein
VRVVRSVLALAVLGLCRVTNAVLYGDEGYLNIDDGRFWVFHSAGVSIVEPESCTIESNITSDMDGQDLPESWYDGIYMQYLVGEDVERRNLEKDGSYQGYVLINSGIDRSNSAGERVSDIYIFDTKKEQVESIVEVGPRPVHGYGVHRQDEFWSHSDGDGHFYVIHLSDLTVHQAKVPVLDALPFHGKLLWDEDGTLQSRGYATSTGEPFLFQVDLATKELTGQYDFSGDALDGTCEGLHGIAYSAINQHVYAECTGGGGMLEFDVSNSNTEFVAQHPDVGGQPYELPDGSYVAAASSFDRKLFVFKPQENGVKSTMEHTVAVPGRPGAAEFYPTDSIDGGADYIACMPSTSNPNEEQMNDNGEVVCDLFTGCTNATSYVKTESPPPFNDDSLTIRFCFFIFAERMMSPSECACMMTP